MRLFVARSIGTDTWITVPVTPYVHVDTGETVSTMDVYDAKRPDCVLPAGAVMKQTLVNWRNAERWVCVANINAAPAGTFDVGDPTSGAFLDSIPSNPTRRSLETELGLANGALAGFTWRQIMQDALSHTTVYRALFPDGTRVTLFGGG